MKHLSYLLLVVLILTGCNIFDSDSGQTVVKDFDVVNVRIKFGEEFVYPLGSLGDEEQASIKEGSPNASVTELFYDFEESVLVKYRYQPTPDFTGDDIVLLEVRRGSDGASPNKDIYYTVLNFNMTP